MSTFYTIVKGVAVSMSTDFFDIPDTVLTWHQAFLELLLPPVIGFRLQYAFILVSILLLKSCLHIHFDTDAHAGPASRVAVPSLWGRGQNFPGDGD